MEGIRCPQCGTELPLGSTQCWKCGCQFGEVQPSTSQKQKKDTNILAATALVFGIMGMLFSCIKVGWVFSIVAIITAIASYKAKENRQGMARSGLICGIIGFFFCFAFWISGYDITSDSSANNGMTELVDSQQEDNQSNAADESVSETSKESESESEARNENEPDSNLTIETENKLETETERESESEVKSTDDNYIYVGESFAVGNLQITFDEYVENFTDYDDPYGWYTPDDGYMYIKVTFTYENIGESGTQYVSIYDFDCYANDETTTQIYSLDSDSFINANIGAGRKKTYSAYFMVPIDSESIELEYVDSGFWSTTTYVLKCK